MLLMSNRSQMKAQLEMAYHVTWVMTRIRDNPKRDFLLSHSHTLRPYRYSLFIKRDSLTAFSWYMWVKNHQQIEESPVERRRGVGKSFNHLSGIRGYDVH